MITIEIGDNLSFTLVIISVVFSVAWTMRKPRP